MTSSDSRQRGFALLIVLWTLALLALIGTQILVTARQGTQLARNLRDAAALEAAAKGAAQQAIFGLLDSSNRHWTAGDAARIIRIGSASIAVRVEDEADKINPNFASAELLRALAVRVGENPVTAAAVAESITEWRAAGGAPGRPDATTARYIAAGRDYAPSGARFKSIDELGAVLGMTPDLLARLRPHLTVLTDGDPNAATHDVVVAQALTVAGEHGAVADTAGGAEVVSVTAAARDHGKARFVVQTIVRINGRSLGSRYDVLAYRQLWGSGL